MQAFDGLTLARVVKFHPHDGSCDCQLLYDGSRLTGVPVLCGMISMSSGRVDWHDPEGVDWDSAGSRTRDITAVLGKVHDQPVVIGFVAQAVSAMLFDRKNFKVDRHASDVYSTIDNDGNLEVAHPSGTFLRVATSPAHEDLTGQDFDKLWSINRNTSKNVWLSVQVANSGGVKAIFQIDPSGNVSLTHAGNLTVSTAGNASLTAASLSITAPTTITGTLAVTGASLTHNGTNVGSTHVHSGITPGGASTGGPG